MNCNNRNVLYENALKKIDHDQQHKPQYCPISVIGPTGPTHPVKSVKYPNF